MFDLDDKGIGYLKAENSKARIVRSVFGLDAVASEKVAMRGRAVREGAGLLTGDAAGVEAEAEEAQVNLLEDVRFVFQDHGAMTLDEILDGLKLLRPDLYGEWNTKTLGSALNDAGVRRQTIYSTTGSKAKDRGVKREWLDVSTTADVTGDEAEEAAAEVIQMPER